MSNPTPTATRAATVIRNWLSFVHIEPPNGTVEIVSQIIDAETGLPDMPEMLAYIQYVQNEITEEREVRHDRRRVVCDLSTFEEWQTEKGKRRQKEAQMSNPTTAAMRQATIKKRGA